MDAGQAQNKVCALLDSDDAEWLVRAAHLGARDAFREAGFSLGSRRVEGPNVALGACVRLAKSSVHDPVSGLELELRSALLVYHTGPQLGCCRLFLLVRECRAGMPRNLIQDALFDLERATGVDREAIFDGLGPYWVSLARGPEPWDFLAMSRQAVLDLTGLVSP